MSGMASAFASSPANERWTVGRWMTDVPIAVCSHVSVRTAFMKIRVGHFRHLLVVDDGRLVGIVTDRDLRRPDISDSIDGWDDLYRLDEETTVRDVMTTEVETVAPSDSLSKALRLFSSRRFGAVPVVEAGVVRGILSTVDVLRAVEELVP